MLGSQRRQLGILNGNGRFVLIDLCFATENTINNKGRCLQQCFLAVKSETGNW